MARTPQRSLRWSIGLLVAAAAVFLAVGLGYAGGPLSVQEAPLAPGGEAYEINPGGPAALLVSDYGANEIRRVDAESGAFVAWRVTTPVDARQDAAGRIWFTDDAATFGFVDPPAGTVTTWSLGDPSEYGLSGIAFDEAGRVWLSEWFGSTSQVRRFDPASGELCAYALPGGSSSYYLLYRENQVWTANWGSRRVYRFDPSTGQGQRWQLSSASFPQGMALDDAGDLWLADSGVGALVHLSPAGGRLATYPAPGGSAPHMLALVDGRVWYSAAGSAEVGMLDPLAAVPAITSAPAAAFTTFAACQTLPPGSSSPVSASAGTLAWSDGAWPQALSSGGWTVYSLPPGAGPYGIAGHAGRLWVVDQGRGMLARAEGAAATATPTPSPTTGPTPARRTYLPLVIR